MHPAAPPTRCEWPLTTNSATLQSALIGNVDSTDSKQRLTTNNSDTQSASSQPTTLLSVVSGDSQPADRRHAMCAYCVIILVLTASNHSQSIRKQDALHTAISPTSAEIFLHPRQILHSSHTIHSRKPHLIQQTEASTLLPKRFLRVARRLSLVAPVATPGDEASSADALGHPSRSAWTSVQQHCEQTTF